MKKLLTTSAIVLGFLAIPAITFAATYEYVNTNGAIVTETASNASVALAQAPNIALHSGVMLVPDTTTTTTTTNPITPTPAPNTTTQAASLRVSLNNLFTEHVTSTLEALRAINDAKTTAMNGAMQEQDANAVDLAAVIGNVYAGSAQSTTLQELRDYSTAADAYATALKSGSMVDQQSATTREDTLIQSLASTLTGPNQSSTSATLLAALRQHESLITQAAQAYNTGNVSQSFTLERQAITQAQSIADMLASSIVSQYPNRFVN